MASSGSRYPSDVRYSRTCTGTQKSLSPTLLIFQFLSLFMVKMLKLPKMPKVKFLKAKAAPAPKPKPSFHPRHSHRPTFSHVKMKMWKVKPSPISMVKMKSAPVSKANKAKGKPAARPFTLGIVKKRLAKAKPITSPHTLFMVKISLVKVRLWKAPPHHAPRRASSIMA